MCSRNRSITFVVKIGSEIESSSLQADAWHHRSDALTSVAAFLGVTIGLVGGDGFEPADDYFVEIHVEVDGGATVP